MKNIMITGCAGFIGSHAVDLFLKKGYRVIGVDCFTYAGNEENIKHQYKNSKFKIYKENICSTEAIKSICEEEKIDWIINFAAESHVDNSIDSCDNFIKTNVVGVKSILEICKNLDIKLFHISTDEVYGSILDGSYKEGDKLSPRNPYSATKAAAEHLILSYANTYGIEYLIARPSNNFGPRQHREKFLPTVIRSLKSGKKIPLYGTGQNIRDWLYVKDCVKFIEYILNNSPMNEIYNITYNNEHRNCDIIEKALESFKIKFEDAVEYVPDRLGHDFRYSINNDKIMTLGFTIESNFDSNFKETIGWFIAQ